MAVVIRLVAVLLVAALLAAVGDRLLAAAAVVMALPAGSPPAVLGAHLPVLRAPLPVRLRVTVLQQVRLVMVRRKGRLATVLRQVLPLTVLPALPPATVPRRVHRPATVRPQDNLAVLLRTRRPVRRQVAVCLPATSPPAYHPVSPADRLDTDRLVVHLLVLQVQAADTGRRTPAVMARPAPNRLRAAASAVRPAMAHPVAGLVRPVASVRPAEARPALAALTLHPVFRRPPRARPAPGRRWRP